MTSQVEVCNMAMGFIGSQARIADINETSQEAFYCRVYWDYSRKMVLAEAAWHFANKRLALADLGLSTADWSYSYTYPADCIRFLGIANPINSGLASTRIPFEVGINEAKTSKIIWTDYAAATGIYTADITAPGLWSVGFPKALAARLAWEIAMPLTGDEKIAQLAARIAAVELSKASAQDANEEYMSQDWTADYQEARN